MGKSISKIRHIQEMNEKIEKQFLQENKKPLNENIFNRIFANIRGLGSRFVTFGQNLGSLASGGTAQNPKLNAAKARLKQRSANLVKEITDFQTDINILFSSEDFSKVQGRVEKLKQKGDTQGATKVRTNLEDFQEEINELLRASETLKGFAQGFINTP